MKLRKLLQNEIKDEYTRENFKRLEQFVLDAPFLRGTFRFFTYTFTPGSSVIGTPLRIPHSLGFIPKDVVTLSVSKSDNAAVIWHFDLFDRDNIYLEADIACTVRALIGSYEG